MNAALLHIPVKPSVLAWARVSAGKTVEEVATRLGLAPETIARWEAGEQQPSLAHLRDLATYLKRPLAAFFLPQPPEEPPLPGDFRRLPEDKAHAFSLKTILAIRRARMIQSAARDFVESGQTLPGLPVAAASLRDKPERLAHALREALGISLATQAGWPSNDAAFRAWRTALENKGFFVAELAFPLNEARAFSIMDQYAPLIVVNSHDSATGKSFSLFHEYAHLLLGHSGVLDNMRDARLTEEGRCCEQFCNAFAGEFLVPRQELENHPLVRMVRTSTALADDLLEALAQHFHVSPQVIIRRLRTLDKVSEAFYQTRSQQYVREAEQLAQQKRFGKRVPAKVCLRENGRTFVALVYDAFDNQRITYKDIADYLGTKPKYVDSVARLLKSTVAA